MAFGRGTISDMGGAVSDIFAGQATASSLRIKAKGDLAEAGNFDLAEKLARQNSQFTKESTEIKLMQAERASYLGIGATQSDISGAGFAASGTALDLVRSGQQQAALTSQMVQRQGEITGYGYEVQADSYRNMASAARAAAADEESLADTAINNSRITAGIKGISAITSLFI